MDLNWCIMCDKRTLKDSIYCSLACQFLDQAEEEEHKLRHSCLSEDSLSHPPQENVLLTPQSTFNYVHTRRRSSHTLSLYETPMDTPTSPLTPITQPTVVTPRRSSKSDMPVEACMPTTEINSTQDSPSSDARWMLSQPTSLLKGFDQDNPSMFIQEPKSDNDMLVSSLEPWNSHHISSDSCQQSHHCHLEQHLMKNKQPSERPNIVLGHKKSLPLMSSNLPDPSTRKCRSHSVSRPSMTPAQNHRHHRRSLSQDLNRPMQPVMLDINIPACSLFLNSNTMEQDEQDAGLSYFRVPLEDDVKRRMLEQVSKMSSTLPSSVPRVRARSSSVSSNGSSTCSTSPQLQRRQRTHSLLSYSPEPPISPIRGESKILHKRH